MGDNQLSLSGEDAGSFQVVAGAAGAELHVKPGVVLDFESKVSYAVTVLVDDLTVGVSPDALFFDDIFGDF